MHDKINFKKLLKKDFCWLC